jgi:hypothetical protein
MPSTYCGNNANHRTLLNGQAVIGSRHSCLKKGIYTGKQIYNADYAGEFNPIDPTRRYCGNAQALPHGYDRYGSNTECLSTGVGIGMAIRAKQAPPVNRVYAYMTLFLAIAVALMSAIFFTKPSFLRKKRKDGSEKWIWWRAGALYGGSLLIVGLTLFGIKSKIRN